jgi:hypothetical protein
MNQRKYIIGLLALAFTVLGYKGANGVMVAKTVLPPGATRSQIVQALLNPPYEMATPHQDLLRRVGEGLSLLRIPGVCAGGVPTPTCDGTVHQATHQPGCPPIYSWLLPRLREGPMHTLCVR